MTKTGKTPMTTPMIGIAEQIWDMKYRFKEVDGTPIDETVDDTWARIAKDLARAEAEDRRAQTQEAFENALSGFRYLPAGRITAGAGTDRNVTLFNCLHGDTPILTREHGLVPIRTVSGETVHVADGNGDWVAAPVHDHGVQELIEVEIGLGATRKNRRVIRATPEHRWVLADGREATTAELKLGNRVPVSYAKKRTTDDAAYARGVAHGIIYGDGSEERDGDTSHGFRVRLCGQKVELIDHLLQVGATSSTPPSCDEDPIVRIPRAHVWADLKSLPGDAGPDYLLGFLRGWFATDGCVGERDGSPILTCGEEGVAFLKTWGPVAGFFPKKTTELKGDTNFGPRKTRVWNVAIANWALEEADLLRSKHRTNRTAASYDWMVTRLEPVGEDRVYCPEVSTTQSFTISDAVLTRNCFVMGTIPDSMPGIFDMLKEAALTMQQGGGIGYDFSTLRPKGEEVKGVGSDASGPLSFMDVWDAMCGTIMSAGSRRGAMMATMRCDHPDIEDFITAKADAARLRKFNLSVLVSDAFMEAVKADESWDLVWKGEARKTVSATELWNRIMKSTYDFAEPGVIFIDRINQRNPLAYAETISSTNPCVPAGTPILTDRGWVDIDRVVDNPVNVWNGEEFSPVTPRVTGHDQPLVTVKLSNGRRLTCTPAHRFVLANGTRINADDLSPGDALKVGAWPRITDGADVPDAYERGRVAAGARAMAFADGTDGPGEAGFVAAPAPREGWGGASRADWVLGVINRIGSQMKDDIVMTSRDHDILKETQLILNTLGESGWIDPVTNATLVVSADAVRNVTGMARAKLDVRRAAGFKPTAEKDVHVVSVTSRTEEADTVYCFTENRRHTGCFDGVLTGQCGEQPLPPYGACLLGSINLTRLIADPFEDEARMDEDEMERLVANAVHMMDNVIEVSRFALPQQEEEAKNKRRIGLGMTGVADALMMLRLTYGTEKAADQLEAWARKIQHAAYRASVELAKEKGAFPLFDAEKYLASPTIRDLDEGLRDEIATYGVRNALLTSIAPTGTISLYAGNVSSGIEPVFALAYNRKITLDDGSKTTEEVVDYAVKMYRDKYGLSPDDPLPEYFVTAMTLTPMDHVRMQAAAQKWVDSSISKTVNCPEDITFENFKEVYIEAYESGCKGCTTYRPNEITGSILSTDDSKQEAPVDPDVPASREEVLLGATYKLKWPELPHAFYITVNDRSLQDGRTCPHEVFINTKNIESKMWIETVTLLLTAVFRRTEDPAFIIKELEGVFDPRGGAFMPGQGYVKSLSAAIGSVLHRHVAGLGLMDMELPDGGSAEGVVNGEVQVAEGGRKRKQREGCPDYGSCDLIQEAGCERCTQCGWSRCG